MSRKSSDENTTTEWFTPSWIVEACRMVMGSIYLDPASCEDANRIVQANQYFDKDWDGLKQHWIAPTVFCNPPGGKIHKTNQSLPYLFWCKLVDAVNKGKVDQGMFLSFKIDNLQVSQQNLFDPILQYPTVVFSKRVKYHKNGLNNIEAPMFPSALTYICSNQYKHRIMDFVDCFSRQGNVTLPATDFTLNSYIRYFGSSNNRIK